MPKQFQKGHKKYPGAGMQKGQKTAKVQQWEALGEYITNQLTGEAIDYLMTLPANERFENYLRLLEYFKPKLQRSEIKAELSPLTPKLQTVYDELQSKPAIPESEV